MGTSTRNNMQSRSPRSSYINIADQPVKAAASPRNALKANDEIVLTGSNWASYAIPVYGEEITEVEIEPVPFSSKLLSCVFAPLLPFVGCGCYTVDAKSESAVLHMGKLTQLTTEPGLHCGVPCGMQVRNVSTKMVTMDLPTSKVADSTGNPVMVSAILNYRVVNSKRALLH